MYEYIKFHRLPLIRVVLNYLFMLYAVGLFFAFTLYPFPDDFASYCAIERKSMQLIPFNAIQDLAVEPIQSAMQIGLNFIFFIPLGVFLRNFWGRRLRFAVPIMFISSLTIELLQLFHPLLPCQYRLFDVDDLVINTCGGLLGYAIGHAFPDFSRTEKSYTADVNTQPRLVQRLVTWLTEWFGTTVVAAIIYLATYFLFLNQVHVSRLYTAIFTIVLLVGQFVLPVLYKGFTPIGLLTNTSLDDIERNKFGRVTYYAVRFVVLVLVCDGNLIADYIPTVVVFLLALTYPISKKPLYTKIK
jgi:glycopeptide antibiotics resistance protein